MNDVRSFFTPQRARPEPSAPAPAPERRTADTGSADFARSLASVRGIDRSAAGLTRADAARSAIRPETRADDRSEVRSDADVSTTVRSRAQVQALMLSGAMKFAAARVTDTTAPTPTVTTPLVTPAELQAGMVMANPIAQLSIADDVLDDVATPLVQADTARTDIPVAIETVVLADAPAKAADIAVNTAPVDDVMTDETADIATIDTSAVAASSTPLATIAAMQLVASLPIADAAVISDDTLDEQPTDAAPSPDDDAPARNMAALAQDLDAPLLVEDHFDVPAVATTAAFALPTVDDVIASSLPAAVTMTFTPGVASEAEAVVAAPTTPITTTSAPKAVRSDVHAVERDVAQLAPEFRERLQKVIDRMQQEFGHDVTVVETVRSQARQAALYAQGRSAPGPVVTWTKNSKHSKGLAADLMVDGQWDNPAGYAHLAQIAKQEGLRTLGARDPGHVELPADGAVSSETLGSLLSDLAGDAGDSARKVRADVDTSGCQQSAEALARVADVAQVARVSQVAQVASVANVARPGASPARSESGAGENVSPLAMTAPMPQQMIDGSAAVRLTAPVSNVNMADRISHLMDLQASQSARPLNSVLLRMDNANGIEDQIRIDTRGTSVDAQLGLGSAQQAAELGARVSELREALERRGLTADGVRVQAASRTQDTVQFSRMAPQAIDMATVRAAADAQAQSDTRDQATRDQQHRDAMARQQDRPSPRSSSDDARHRSRREQPETRQ